ncbi:MAG: efflux RND transporter permease subunit [Gammaproteobacteria bacterium]|jgi:multidrug efflux pump subunit AcrB|nr:efflux RND transporter permease subunit [Gammaproteobacteria bacterium]MBT5333232.1 efflux RND transporter permease subunit [Gammaproteobacteria bacterium]
MSEKNVAENSKVPPVVDVIGPPPGIIGWFASNHVASNLLMVFIFAFGLLAIFDLKKESMPSIVFDRVSINVAYPGAGPEEVELGIVVKIEEALNSIEGIREIRSTAREGMASVDVRAKVDFEIAELTDEIKLAIDSISTFPLDSERPVISKVERKMQTLRVAVSGNLDETAMKYLADDIKDEITALPEVTYASILGGRDFEVAVEIPEDRLREYNLSLSEVAQIIRRWSADIPGGTIKSEAGSIRLRAMGQAYSAQEFENIIVLTNADGSILRLGDIASVTDGFVEEEFYAFFNGKPSLAIEVQSTDQESEIKISDAVHAYVEARRATLPSGISLDVWADSSFYLKSQIDMLVKNMMLGAVLVFVVLGLFLRLRMAIWVLIGLPIAFFGAALMMPWVDVTINIISLFAFILVLGIVVDDAIIIAESVHTQTERDGYNLHNIVAGAQRVAVPATFGVLTTIMAFAPMLLVTGPPSSLTAATAWVVIFCLLFSLVESKLILPSHLAMLPPPKQTKRGIPEWVNDKLQRFVKSVYQPFVLRAIEFRYATVATFVGMIMLVLGLMWGGFIKYGFFPDIDQPILRASVEVQEGSPPGLAQQVVDRMYNSALRIENEIIAESPTSTGFIQNVLAFVAQDKQGFILIELLPNEQLQVLPEEIERRWREDVGEIAGTTELKFISKEQMGGAPVSFKLLGKNTLQLEAAAAELQKRLSSVAGVYEVAASVNEGPQELSLKIKPTAETLGITLVDLASQVREAFYGAEAQRFQRDSQEIKVMVRYPKSERRSIGDLEGMWIKVPSGQEVPFSAAAEFELAQGYDVIRRIDKERAVNISANVNTTIVESNDVLRQVRASFESILARDFAGVSMELDGSSKDERAAISELWIAVFFVLAGIYALLAVPLKSYLQPLIIMSVIPFGLIGAILGHFFLGKTVSIISLLGFIALGGVVVNDSLIMVDFVNKKVRAGMSHAQASVEAGTERFRPIILTSLTTFFGLVPILSETSTQAQMIIPMAISLAFGILFATIITLILVPALYNIFADFMPDTRRSASAQAQPA